MLINKMIHTIYSTKFRESVINIARLSELYFWFKFTLRLAKILMKIKLFIIPIITNMQRKINFDI